MKIPTFECKPGCGACCGIVPFTQPEKERASALRPLEQWEPFLNGSFVPMASLETMTCPFRGKNGCEIYEQRPMVCRLFGSVDHPNMRCPMGCAPKKMLTDAQSRELLARAA